MRCSFVSCLNLSRSGRRPRENLDRRRPVRLTLFCISSARYLDCRNRGTRFLLRDFASRLSSRRAKHPEIISKQEKHPPLGITSESRYTLPRRRDVAKICEADQRELQLEQSDTGRNYNQFRIGSSTHVVLGRGKGYAFGFTTLVLHTTADQSARFRRR